MNYEAPGCAYCPSTVRACRQGEGDERGPGFCPSKVDPDGIAEAFEEFARKESLSFFRVAPSTKAA